MLKRTDIEQFPIFADLPPVENRNMYKPPQPSTDPVQMKRESQVNAMLGSPTRVTLIDGRVYQGYLLCVDQNGTLILRAAKLINATNDDHSYIDMVIIEKHNRKKVQILDSEENFGLLDNQ